MVSYKNINIYLLFVLLLLWGCGNEKPEEQTGTGWLSVDFLTDKSLQTKSNAPLYALQIQKPDGSVVASYDDCSEISERILLKSGDYKLVATNGADVLAGFDCPFYKGEQSIKIEPSVTKNVSLICTQANVKVTVGYSDLIKKNFPNYSLEVVNGGGKLLFAKEEVRAGYLRASENSIVWNLTLDNGQEVYHLTKTITGVAERQHYRFNFDIRENGGEDEGAFVSGIVVDTTADVYNWMCEIVLKESIAKPEIKRRDGVAMKEPVLVLNETRGVDAKVDITAQARIQDLKIRHSSPVVKALGIPETITLTNMSAELKAAVNNAGISWGNEDVLNAQAATLDFSGLLNQLPLGSYAFMVSVYDARMRLVTDTLRVSVIPDIDHIADEANVVDVWAKFATIRGRWYTLGRPEGLAFEYSTDQVNWTAVPQGDIQYNDATKLMEVCLQNLTPGTVYYYRTVSAGLVSEDIRSFTTSQALQLPGMNFDVWYKSGKIIYTGDANNRFWDSGNQGASSMNKNPTDGTDEAVAGKAAKMVSQYVGIGGALGKFAAGNLYSGQFAGLDGMNALLDFGRPYTCRPTSMSGYYKYFPKTINNGNYKGLSGTMDSCHIYVALCDWTDVFHVVTKDLKFVDLNGPDIIAFGELKGNQEVGEYRKFTIDIHYRDNRIPKYVLVVATASKYGDYFTGGEGSTLFLDELEFGFDYLSK